MQDVLVFDAESNGLHGPVFAIGGVVVRDGRMAEWFFARCHIEGDVDPWVAANALPALDAGFGGSPVTHDTPRAMRDDFWRWLTTPRENTIVAVDCGWPVEAGLLTACVADDPTRAFKGPYPLHEVATFLVAAGMDPLAKYAPIVLPDARDNAHHPVFDAHVSALCVEMAMAKRNAVKIPVTAASVPDYDSSFATASGKR